MTGDVGLAEDLAQEALVAALESWPRDGVPPNPGAWLMTTAKNRAIDGMRRDERLERKREEIGRDLERRGPAAPADAALDEIGDDLLSLIFTCCHPVLSREARVALTLRMLGGLRTEEIARAFLVPSPTIGQRISRAKKTLAEAERAVRGPGRRRARRALPARPRGDLPDLQRGLHGDRRRRTGCGRRSARTPCGSAGSSPSSRRASPRCTASSR